MFLVLVYITLALLSVTAYVLARRYVVPARRARWALHLGFAVTSAGTALLLAAQSLANAKWWDMNYLHVLPAWLTAPLLYPYIIWHLVAFVVIVYMATVELALSPVHLAAVLRGRWKRWRYWEGVRPEASEILPGRRAFLQRSTMAVAAFSGTAFSYGAARAAGLPAVEEITIWVTGLPDGLEGFRIAQLSDMHAGPFVTAEDLRAAAGLVNEMEVDAVALTGDFVSGTWHNAREVCEGMGALDPDLPVFACLGNHEYYTDTGRLIGALTAGGIRMLRNEHAMVEKNGARLAFVGVDDLWMGTPRLKRALAGIPAGTPRVLLAHNPDFFPAARAERIELTLSGHTHAGQVVVPTLAGSFNLADTRYRHSAGLYVVEGLAHYVNRGFGTTGPPVRINCPPELTILTLRRREPGRKV